MNTQQTLKNLLFQTLQPGPRASLRRDSPLLGPLPEFDLGRRHPLNSDGKHFGFSVEGDEFSADTFATLDTFSWPSIKNSPHDMR